MKPTGFVMTLQHADRSRGQVTPNTQQRSAEIFIPIKARRLVPSFWGWPDKFIADPNGKGKRDRPLKIRMGVEICDAKLMFWPEKDDLRLRSESIRSRIKADNDLLLLVATAEKNVDYDVVIIDSVNESYKEFLGYCLMSVDQKKSKKHFGYLNEDFLPFNPPRDFWLLVIHREEGPKYSLFPGKEKNRATDELRSLERTQLPCELVHLAEQFD